MVSGALLSVFIGGGVAIMAVAGMVGVRWLLGCPHRGRSLLLGASADGYVAGGAMVAYALFPRSVI